MESGQEWFMISEEEKGAALEVVPKVEDGRIDRQQLPVKCGVTALSGREFGGVESQGEPVAMMPLLKDSSNMGVGGVSSKTNGGSGIRMGEEGRLGKGRFCSLERSGHGRSPVESAGRTLEGISEGLEQAGGVGKETAVEVDQAKETLEILNSVWLGVVENGVDIGGKRSDASGGDLMAKEGNRRLGKGAFGEVDQKAVGLEDVEELGEMRKVLGKVGTGHQNIIQVNKEEGKTVEKVVHKALEGLGGVAEAKWHGEEFVEAKRGDDSSLRDIRRMNRDLVIAFHQIQLGEDSGTMEAGREVLEIGKRIAVGNGGKIKAAVIATRPPGTIRLGHKMERGRPGAVGAANNTRLLHFVKLLLGLLEADRIKAAGFGKNRRASGFNVMEDAMLRGVTMEICGENCGVLMKKLADGGRAGVKIGEGGKRGGRRRGRRRVRKDSVGRFMEYMAAGRINNKMVSRKEVIA